jgi:hypothetical protein
MSGEWQPIETLPTSGDPVIVLLAETEYPNMWGRIRFAKFNGKFWRGESNRKFCNIIKWMPRPGLPK